MTTVFDAAGEGSAKACWVLMRRAKRTSLSPQALPRNLRGCSRLPVTAPKNRTRIGPHLGRRKVSLFSPKSGYVRRSEISKASRGRSSGNPSKESGPCRLCRGGTTSWLGRAAQTARASNVAHRGSAERKNASIDAGRSKETVADQANRYQSSDTSCIVEGL